MKWGKYNRKSKSNYVYSGFYAKHLNLYMTNRIIIYRHLSIKTDNIVNKTIITSTFWIDCFFHHNFVYQCINKAKDYIICCYFQQILLQNYFYINNITQITLHRKLRWRDIIHKFFIHTINIGVKSKYILSLILAHTVICWNTFCDDPDNFEISLFTNNLTVWSSLGSSNIWLLTVYSFALKQFVSNLPFIVPFQWQHEKQRNWSPWLNVDYKQLLDNIIATGVWR